MRRQVLRLLAIALAVHAGVSAAAAPLCHHSSAAAPALVRLREALARGRFVAYQPTALKVVDGRFSNADPASIRADLEVLRGHFDSLVTYDAVHGAQDSAKTTPRTGAPTSPAAGSRWMRHCRSRPGTRPI